MLSASQDGGCLVTPGLGIMPGYTVVRAGQLRAHTKGARVQRQPAGEDKTRKRRRAAES